MARANRELIDKLREAAAKIESGADYCWGHVGHCNCGHLAQCITPLTSSEIYQRAYSQALEEWSEYAQDYCPSSGAPMDMIMDAMFAIGLELKDIHQLEYLSNQQVLNALPGGFRYLRKGQRSDAALYMRTWAALMEVELYEKQKHLSAYAPALT
ncbi:hypothetical protein [Rubellicoccus peritrichatus]|uniref:Uncharacterized protein n=1 Tax=Rubellicoccus peritrichatus TaxID=3080537 RepID=A0AAQ3QQY5_9BACT|nr:hypothetical protein [Puniceicoccus sp. CR14]WOO40748.1 hypothetical protein RZN69_19165 [Puniceicoccus sp. CR14]